MLYKYNEEIKKKRKEKSINMCVRCAQNKEAKKEFEPTYSKISTELTV